MKERGAVINCCSTASEKMQQPPEVKAEITSPQAPQMTSFALATQNELFQPAFTWTIHGISKLMGRKKFKVKTKSLKATQTGYQDTDAGAGLSVEANGRVRVCLILQKVGPFQPQIFFLIRDRSGAREPQHVCASMHELFGVIFGVYTVENKNHAEKSCLTLPAYNVDDSLVVDFYVEPPVMAQHAHSYEGTLDWSIDNFRRRKQMEIAGLINGQESPYFYTGPTGYRVQLKFILQGAEENKGKGPSVKVRLLKGTWDKELPKAYPHRMTLTLLNRSDALANIERKIERKLSKNKKSYLVHVCSDQQLESLIENDTLYYYVTFENILSK